MAKYGKRLRNAYEEIGKSSSYDFMKALELIKSNANAKFDETVEVALNCQVDPKKADQNLRGNVQFPEGTGKTVRVAVFARDNMAKEAKEAGADIVGAEDLFERIQKGEIDFDRCIATPDMMILVGKLGKILGPRGLMPNPRLGTVTKDVGQVVRDIKGGQVAFRVDKAGIIHCIIGKASFSIEALQRNFNVLWDIVLSLKPASIKKDLVKSAFVASTMGPSVNVDLGSIKK